jgi:YidC/Oxa1 family membrane protein insertase
MSTEKRLVLFLILSVFSLWGMQFLMGRLGLLPPPRRPAVAQAPAAPGKGQDAAAKPADADAAATKPDAVKPEALAGAARPADATPEPEGAAPEVALVPEAERTLGSIADRTPGGYRLELVIDQRGAGVERLRSSRIESEIKEGVPKGRPLELIQADPRHAHPDSFSVAVRPAKDAEGNAVAPPEPGPAGLVAGPSAATLWEVVRDEQGLAVRPVTKPDATTKATVTGQEIVLRSAANPAKVTVTRTYRLWPGEDGFELELGFESPDAERTLAYELLGPHGIPIEGDWYTGTFRDLFFGGVGPNGTQVLTKAAYNVAKDPSQPERYTSLPLRYAGVENQYFAVLLAPQPPPASLEDSRVAEARSVVVAVPGGDATRADVSVELLSKPFAVGPNRPARHAYRVFAGPKTAEALAAVGAEDVSAYRKGWSLPLVGDLGASFMAQRIIAPLLVRIYAVTEAIGRAFGGTRGNWGLAIILLTMTVRMILFPLGRKQARAAQKMQELQPLLMKLKEECGEDKEKFAREQFALFKQYGVNPMGGCLPALVQLPVLIGLWQALNNSVSLRHSSFLWMENLAAPDMLFKFPFPIPLVGQWLGPYFNLLPILVVVLMLVQTKLFSPPATTPEAQAQQNMMKYMMIFMAFMFYKVPSGLGIYFITSSLWQIGERLLLPKSPPLAVAGAGGPAVAAAAESSKPGRGAASATAPAKGSGKDRGREPAAPASTGGFWDGLRDRARQIVEDADKQRTVRNNGDGPAPGSGPGRERDTDRNRPRPGGGRKR